MIRSKSASSWVVRLAALSAVLFVAMTHGLGGAVARADALGAYQYDAPAALSFGVTASLAAGTIPATDNAGSSSVGTSTTWVPTSLLATDGRLPAAEDIETPYGLARQGADAASQGLRGAVREGSTVYRQGRFGVQETTEGQFWAGENPLTTADYAAGYGTPGSGAPDWVMGGELKWGEPFITRPAPGLGANAGGAPEVVTRPGGVGDLWFHMP